jgi:hypothetical protein
MAAVSFLRARLRRESSRMLREISIDRKLRFNDPSANFGWSFYQDLEGKEA